MPSTHSPRVWAALLVVYVVWGSTYLAIRIAIETLPPFLMASTRFLVAGSLLFLWSVRRGDRVGDRPGWPQWRAAAIVGAALLLGGNGGVVWAEGRIASGVAALLVATLSLWMALLAWLSEGERPSRVGLPLGFGGLALLVGPVETTGIDPAGVVVCTLASLSWAAGSLYARRAALPARSLVATGMEMITGGGWLLLAGLLTGELGRVRPEAFSAASVVAFAYLVLMGSLVAFSAYIWLLRAAPTTLVATYAYVNPVVAVGLGWLFAGEPVTPTRRGRSDPSRRRADRGWQPASIEGPGPVGRGPPPVNILPLTARSEIWEITLGRVHFEASLQVGRRRSLTMATTHMSRKVLNPALAFLAFLT
ncbi:MAG: EamA family transporter, partial [Candidatus Binatia bacterium]